MNFQTVVMNISDLDQSLAFYRDVFGFIELSRRDQLVALYVTSNDRNQVIVLRELGTTGRTGGARHTGIRAIVLEVDSIDDVDRIAAALEVQGRLVAKRHGTTWTAAFGRDPDHIAVVAGCSLNAEPISLEAWAALDESLYAVGE